MGEESEILQNGIHLKLANKISKLISYIINFYCSFLKNRKFFLPFQKILLHVQISQFYLLS